MDAFISLIPVILIALAALTMLYITAADREDQIIRLKTSWSHFTDLGSTWPQLLKKFFSPYRIIVTAVLLFLATYIWVYQTLQDEVADLMAEKQVAVTVASLIIPYTAFFRSEYISDTGFTKSKKRARANISVKGRPWSGFALDIADTEMAKIVKITGKKFVFEYLSDVKVLEPVIHKHMKRLLAAKQIDKYEIETYDNRGPYLVVALNEKHKGKAINQVADTLAAGLHTTLTITNQLKVNQVVIKIVDPEQYINHNKIRIIGRGTAGSY